MDRILEICTNTLALVFIGVIGVLISQILMDLNPSGPFAHIISLIVEIWVSAIVIFSIGGILLAYIYISDILLASNVR
ncbi:hypothetical protein OB955_04860 [Halobacteria archaeon AArc-m2/3/4]|uniref:Uncharacterized protein n=1 Tax=Natronoglomus mannanivorans TaxID=2979990 RepID=A0ABT2QAW2_9EURY|nr:hypothetical protein [Halobacteria archaeon AArc-m2/3/4]